MANFFNRKKKRKKEKEKSEDLFKESLLGFSGTAVSLSLVFHPLELLQASQLLHNHGCRVPFLSPFLLPITFPLLSSLMQLFFLLLAAKTRGFPRERRVARRRRTYLLPFHWNFLYQIWVSSYIRFLFISILLF